mmetsp:Transcript_103293/g.308574  ORF Transcript_103293/g.308574 Transcript_103293/m.308574 type:complete len:358 (-) Transcript_103293:217-1290(-)
MHREEYRRDVDDEDKCLGSQNVLQRRPLLLLQEARYRGRDGRLEGVCIGGDHGHDKHVHEYPDALVRTLRAGRLRHLQNLEEDKRRDGVVRASSAKVLCLQQHTCEAEEERQEANQSCTDNETNAELLVVLRGIDPLPESQVEDLGAEDGKAEGHGHLKAAVGGKGDLVPVLLPDVHPAPDCDADAKDEDEDAPCLDPVRHDGGGEAAKHGVQHRDDRKRDHACLWDHARELGRHVAHGLQLPDQVDEHVVDEDERHPQVGDEPESLEDPIGDIGAVRHLLAELGREVAHDQGARSDGHAVAHKCPPATHDGRLGGRVEQPSTRRCGADAEGNARPTLGVPGAVPEVDALCALCGVS